MKKIIIILLSVLMLTTLSGCKGEQKPVEQERVQEETEVVEEQTDVQISELELLQAIERWGVDPGLGISTLHKLGYTGKGVNVAYCDQPIDEPFHDEIKDSIVSYTNNTDSKGAMHGNAVSSFLCGKNIGTAPEANVYFYTYASWEDDQQKHWVKCLEELIEDNKKLPEGEKIRMVGFSNNIRDNEPYAKEVRQAVKKCNDNDIMVFWCGENAALAFYDFSDRDNPENAYISLESTDAITTVPADTRTSLGEQAKYTYWDNDGGLSWTLPYTLGVYAIAQSIDYDITQEEIYDLVKQTNYTNSIGVKVFQPVEFIAKVLENNNRKEDADILRNEYKKNFKYRYVLYNSKKIDDNDLASINAYVDSINDCHPILFDCAEFSNANAIYKALQEDHKQKGGEIVGVQILGNSDLVHPFEITYEALMVGGLDTAGSFYSDYFYQNLDNNIDIVNTDYSVNKQFENNYDFDLTPKYPLARLPLAKGEFTDFFNKYNDFVATTKLAKLDLVNFSNPIFASENHLDDFGIFLDRLQSEFKVIDKKYELYGNTLGQYPVKNENIIGSFNKDNLSKVNSEKIVELVINTHGQRDNIDLCYYENNEEKRQSVLNMNDINTVLDDNYYYLDLWTCNNGYDMKNNLTTTALNGKAVGVFSANHIISNNGVNNSKSVTDMKKANFYYFYYTYLRTLNSGFSRSTSFFKAQYKYYKTLMNMSQYKIEAEGNYQFNFNNLLDYENYGILNNDYLERLFLDDAYQDGSDVEIETKFFELLDVIVEDDDSNYKITINFISPEGYNVDVFNPPNADIILLESNNKTVDGENSFTFVVDKDTYNSCDMLMTSVYKSDDDRCFFQVK